jgi:hypothetical protein
MLTTPPAHLSPAGRVEWGNGDIIFYVHGGSTLSLTGVTLQNGNAVCLTDKYVRGGDPTDTAALICCCFRSAPVANKRHCFHFASAHHRISSPPPLLLTGAV